MCPLRLTGAAGTTLRGDLFGGLPARPDYRASSFPLFEPPDNAVCMVRHTVPAEAQGRPILQHGVQCPLASEPV
jgi:hypothetical protein